MPCLAMARLSLVEHQLAELKDPCVLATLEAERKKIVEHLARSEVWLPGGKHDGL